MSDFLWLNGQQSARLLCPQDSPGNNIGAGLYWLYSRQEYWCALLQGIFLTQGLDPCLLCLLHWQSGSSPLVAPGKPTQCEWVPSNPLRDSAEPKGRGRTFSLAAWAGTSVFCCPQISTLLVLRPLESDQDLHHYPSAPPPNWSVLSILFPLIGHTWVRIGILLGMCLLCIPSSFICHVLRMWPLLQPWGCWTWTGWDAGWTLASLRLVS